MLGALLALAVLAVVYGVSTGVLGEPEASPVTSGETAGETAGEPTQAGSSTPTGGSTVDIPERLVDDARWVEREGERALEVSPADRLREASDQAVYEEAWRRVVRAVPEADSPGMRDQFLCHAAFASTKDAWYLEPARPAVGYWSTVRAGCNPGDVIDVG